MMFMVVVIKKMKHNKKKLQSNNKKKLDRKGEGRNFKLKLKNGIKTIHSIIINLM